MPAARRLPATARVVLPQAPGRHPARGDGLSADSAPLQRPIAIGPPYDFDESLRFVPFGLYDPTCHLAPGLLRKAGHTPDGPATLELRRTAAGALATAWGDGAHWALARAEALLGAGDDPSGFSAAPLRVLAVLARRFRGLRLSRSPWVLDGLVGFVMQQRVSFRDAVRAHRRLVTALSPPAPGPGGLRLPLSRRDWLRLSDEELLRAGVDGQRARALRAAAREGRRVDACFGLDVAAARAVLGSIAGCGPWTVGVTMGFVLGDPDAVPTGDLHLPHEIAWALAGEPRANDARMVELLRPWAGARFRVIRLLLAAGRILVGRSSRRARASSARLS